MRAVRLFLQSTLPVSFDPAIDSLSSFPSS